MTNKSCENCNYFIQFYRMQLSHIKRVGWGSCNFKKVKIISLKNNSCKQGCENWEPAEITRQVRLKHIDTVIRETEDHLRQIELILKTPQ